MLVVTRNSEIVSVHKVISDNKGYCQKNNLRCTSETNKNIFSCT